MRERDGMRAYLEDLLKRLADQATVSSTESVSWAAHREAEGLSDVTMVDELAEATRSLKPRQRAGCYFTIGKIGLNLGEERCAQVLLNLIVSETDKYSLSTLLNGLRPLPKGPELDLSAVYALLEDERWLVRHAAIQALENSASAEAESSILRHLTSTDDPHDLTYCHSVLSTIGTPRALPAIEANLRSRKRDVKASAEWAVRQIRDRTPRP